MVTMSAPIPYIIQQSICIEQNLNKSSHIVKSRIIHYNVSATYMIYYIVENKTRKRLTHTHINTVIFLIIFKLFLFDRIFSVEPINRDRDTQ